MWKDVISEVPNVQIEWNITRYRKGAWFVMLPRFLALSISYSQSSLFDIPCNELIVCIGLHTTFGSFRATTSTQSYRV